MEIEKGILCRFEINLPLKERNRKKPNSLGCEPKPCILAKE